MLVPVGDCPWRFVGLFGLPVIAVEPLTVQHTLAASVSHLNSRDRRVATRQAQRGLQQPNNPQFRISVIHEAPQLTTLYLQRL